MRSVGKMKAALCMAVVAMVSLAGGCFAPRGTDAVAAGDHRGTVTAGGIERTYLLHRPPGHDRAVPAPLVIVLHGGGGKGKSMEEFFALNALADREGFVAAYPDGLDRHWNDGRDVKKYRSHRKRIDDVEFISVLIDVLAEAHGIDRHRVYVTGASNGGMMTNRLACELADRIAAVAPIIAAMPENIAGECFPSRPVPVLMINGTDDPMVPWDGGHVRFRNKVLGRVLSVPGTVSFWISQNGCSNTSITTDEPDRDPEDGTRVRKHAYGRCTGRVEVILYEVQGGGHTWPSGKQYLPEFFIGRTSRDVEAGEVIWEFFKKYRRELPPPPAGEAVP